MLYLWKTMVKSVIYLLFSYQTGYYNVTLYTLSDNWITYNVREIHFHDNKWKFAPCENKLLYSNQFLDSYSDFLNRVKTLSQKLVGQGYVQPLLLSSLHKFYGRHHDIIERYEVFVSQMRINIFRLYFSPDLTLPDVTPHWIDSFTMWRVLYTEQDMLTHPKHLMSLPVFMAEANEYGKRSAWFLHLVSNTYMCIKMFMNLQLVWKRINVLHNCFLLPSCS
jgi:hypothetical protein